MSDATDHLLAARRCMIDADQAGFADHFRCARQALGDTQREMAERISVSQAKICRWERCDQRPTYEELEIIRGLAERLQEDANE